MEHFGISREAARYNQDLIGFLALYHPAVRKAIQLQMTAEDFMELMPDIPAELQASIDQAKPLDACWKPVPEADIEKMRRTPEDRMIACGWVGGERVRTGM